MKSGHLLPHLSSVLRLPSSRSAFTLVELLVVITIIGILVGIVLGVSGLAVQKGDRARAIKDLTAIKNALEEHRIAYGTYPLSFTSGDSADWLTNLWVKPQQGGRAPFITANFLTNETMTARYVDPWGNDYQYLHRSGVPNYADHNNSKFGYDLWSLGPHSTSNADDIANWKGDF